MVSAGRNFCRNCLMMPVLNSSGKATSLAGSTDTALTALSRSLCRPTPTGLVAKTIDEICDNVNNGCVNYHY